MQFGPTMVNFTTETCEQFLSPQVGWRDEERGNETKNIIEMSNKHHKKYSFS